MILMNDKFSEKHAKNKQIGIENKERWLYCFHKLKATGLLLHEY